MNCQTIAINTLAALFLAGFAASDEAGDKAILIVQAWGGDVNRDQKMEGKPVTEVVLPGRPVTDGGLKELGAFKELRVLHLNETKITDAGLKHVAPLLRLQHLYLTQTKVTDAGL